MAIVLTESLEANNLSEVDIKVGVDYQVVR